jgi:signal transduction histidine kinase
MSYRAKLLIAMTLVAVSITGLGLLFVQRKVAAETEHDLELSFNAKLNALHTAQEVRQAALAERCRSLIGRPRILAALEDNALDLLYPSAKDELRDLMSESASAPGVLRARFYRFLDRQGNVLRSDNREMTGRLSAEEERELILKGLPEKPQMGFMWHEASQSVVELFAVPIHSSATGELISALVVGFGNSSTHSNAGEIVSGVLLKGKVYFPAISSSEQQKLERIVGAEVQRGKERGNFSVEAQGKKERLFFNLLNAGSSFPPAYELCLYPLDALLARQQTLRWQAAAICGVLLLSGVIASQILAGRLSKPVEKLEVTSAENLAQRQKAEAALEVTSMELQRAARFSADASHQLKTPVTVLRAGLDELLATENLSTETREEISSLLHQTYRLNNIIEDLLLLSRMDAGRLRLNPGVVNLTEIVEGWLDDFSTLGNNQIAIETDFKCDNLIVGEKRYTAIILENLLENARKYNRNGGKIEVATRREGKEVIVRVGNNGRTIPPAIQPQIFERFHRGTAGENVPGYGLGLNIARELARLHGGELRLARSENDWTEFEVSFCHATEVTEKKGATFA